MPAGYLVVGDAACAPCPAYGHGITMAAESATALDRLLRPRVAAPAGPARVAFDAASCQVPGRRVRCTDSSYDAFEPRDVPMHRMYESSLCSTILCAGICTYVCEQRNCIEKTPPPPFRGGYGGDSEGPVERGTAARGQKRARDDKILGQRAF